jgi:hypothetical protein
MGMHWLEYVIGVVGKFEGNTFVLSVTISHLSYFGTATPKEGVLFVSKQVSSLKHSTQWLCLPSCFRL